MLVVSNSSPLINLAIINHLGLLKTQFAQVVIPPDVYLELRIEGDLPGTPALRDAFREGWVGMRERREKISGWIRVKIKIG
ncbi:MAG: hypothetical protein HY070_09790 [Chloroflexi bacterium]|nr:hypothetical protein [Chloroflexota bacterium]